MADVPRLTRVLIEGMFDEDAPPIDIRMRLDERVTILHGRNGSGKTRTLELLDALQRGALETIRRAPFSRFVVEVSDGSSVEMWAQSQTRGDPDERQVHYRVRHPGDVTAEGVMGAEDTVDPDPVVSVNSVADLVLQIKPLRRLPRPSVPPWLRPSNDASRGQSPSMVRRALDTHSKLLEFCKTLPEVKFIRADRLRTQGPLQRWSDQRESGSVERELTVERLSDDIRDQVQQADQEYRLASARLDSALRNRLVHHPKHPDPPELDTLRARNVALAREQKRLSRLGLFPEEPSPFESDAFTEENRRMLALLLDDGEQKLNPFRRLADRAEQLLDTLNRKLAPKVVKLDVKTGYHVTSGSGQALPLPALSSGEQHELVLLHELLFDAEPGTLVLIDEPELSLHPSWQVEFLPDLLEIAKISELDFILATHSPYIIGDRTDLMVRLGHPFDEHP